MEAGTGTGTADGSDDVAYSSVDVLVEGSIFLRGDDSSLVVTSPQRVKFATSFIEVNDGVFVDGRGVTYEAARIAGEDAHLHSSVFIDATAVITSYGEGSHIEINGEHDVDVYGTVLAGGSIGPTGVTWSGPDAEVTVTSGEQVYIQSGLLASGG